MKLALFNFLICMVITIIIAPFIIKFLYKLKFGQSILIYVEKHKQKGGTATMGGIIFLISSEDMFICVAGVGIPFLCSEVFISFFFIIFEYFLISFSLILA